MGSLSCALDSPGAAIDFVRSGLRDAAAATRLFRRRCLFRRILSPAWRWCTNRNWHATVPTTGASSTDGVGSWAAHVGHRIQHIARELRVDRSPTGCPGSKTIADDRRIPEAGVLDSRVLMVA